MKTFLDFCWVLDKDEVGNALINLEAREITKFLFEQLAIPLHIISHLTIVVVTLKGSYCYSLREAVIAKVFVGIAEEILMSLTHEAETHAQAWKSVELTQGA